MALVYDARLVIAMDEVETNHQELPGGGTEEIIHGNWFRVYAASGDREVWSARVLLSEDGTRVQDRVGRVLLQDSALIDLVSRYEQAVWSAVS